MRSDFADIVDVPIRPVGALPPSAPNGAEVDLLADAAAVYGGPFLWRCKYRRDTPGPYKWHVIGEAPSLESRADAATNAGMSGGVLGEYTGTPNIDLPFAGVWDLAWGFQAYYGPPMNIGAQIYSGLKIGTTEAPLATNTFNDQVLVWAPAYGGSASWPVFVPFHRPWSRYTISAATNVRMRHLAHNHVPSVAGRYIAARPARLR